MSYVQRDITADDLDGLPGGAIVVRHRNDSIRPMQKWPHYSGGTWSVLGEFDEFQTAAHVNYHPVDRYVLVYLPDTEEGST